MLDRALQWMNQRYPEGFFCYNLGQNAIDEIRFSGIVSLNTPVLFQLDPSLLQDCIIRLIDSGISPTTACFVLSEPLLSGTLGNIAIKVRSLNPPELHLVVEI